MHRCSYGRQEDRAAALLLLGEKAGAPALLALQGRKGRRCLVLARTGHESGGGGATSEKRKKKVVCVPGLRAAAERFQGEADAQRCEARGISRRSELAPGHVCEGPRLPDGLAGGAEGAWVGGGGSRGGALDGGPGARGGALDGGQRQENPSLLACATPATRRGETYFTLYPRFQEKRRRT